MSEQKKILPAVALRGMTVMPEMVVHFDISRERSVKAVQEAMLNDQTVFLVTQKKIDTDTPDQEELYSVGIIAKVKQVLKMPKNVLRVLVTGEQRARLVKLEQTEPYLTAEITPLEDYVPDLGSPVNIEGMIRGLKDLFMEYGAKSPRITKELAARIVAIKDLKELIEQISANLPLQYEELQQLLNEDDLMKRYEMLSLKLATETQIMDIKEEIQYKVKERIDQHQKEYILREQLKLIREELGDEAALSDAEEFEEATERLEAPEEVKEKLKKEIKRFKNTIGSTAENGVIRTYIETMLEMPWNRAAKDSTDLKFAKQVLEEDHYGLEEVKDRILDFLAVRALTKKGDSPILCLVGPPGTGKTSIARSLARALKKPYVRISLGGVRDEAEIRGHRKTYVGAMPGRIANGLRSAGVKNPVMLLDEIDKVSTDYKGDTFSGLLEVLDGEQNVKFRDHYLEVPVDLSEVLFITTANTLQTIPRPLLDRMEVIEISSYTENEKMHIATEHLCQSRLRKTVFCRSS